MRCTIITDLSIDLYSWETAWFLMPGVVEQLAMVNVNRSELGSVDNIPQWGSSRLKRRRKCSRGREERKESRIRTDRERKWKENGKIWREKRNLRRSGRMMSELTCNTEERGRERERERREREREREAGCGRKKENLRDSYHEHLKSSGRFMSTGLLSPSLRSRVNLPVRRINPVGHSFSLLSLSIFLDSSESSCVTVLAVFIGNMANAARNREEMSLII